MLTDPLYYIWKSAHIVGPYVTIGLPLFISGIALAVSLKDRRPHLVALPRKGDWYKIAKNIHKNEIIFMGVVEVYNSSSRANAIRKYSFWRKKGDEWEAMESEFYKNIDPSTSEAELFNQTPFSLAPYSGSELSVQAFSRLPQPYEMDVRIELEDLFGKKYRVEVKAKS